MAISLKHLFQSAKTDGPDNTIVQPSDWNDEHVLTQATGKLLGRTTAGTGATEEIAPGTGITLSAGTLSADVTSVAGRTGAVTLSTADISGLTTGYVQKTSATGSAYLPAGTTGQREGSPSAGYIRYNTTTGKFEGFGSSWGNIGGGAAIGDTPPANPGAGDLWWNSADGRMYVYYTDANSSQWVDLSAGGAGQYLPLTGGDVTGNVTVTGNFGLGTSSPEYKMHVSGGTAGFTSTNGRLLISGGNTSGGVKIGAFTSSGSANGYLAFEGFDREYARFDSNANFQFNSGYGSVATAYGCRAWVNFNGLGTVSIRASGNVSSITDYGVGDYGVNLTNAMPDANYAVVSQGGQNAANNPGSETAWSLSTTSFRISHWEVSVGLQDLSFFYAAVFR